MRMKKTVISIIGIGSLGWGCSNPPMITNPPPQPETFNPPPDTGIKNNIPSWDDVKAPKEGVQAELILTPNGCYKKWVDAKTEAKDRYEESNDHAQFGTLIECPPRAKNIKKEPPKPNKEPSPQKRNNPQE